MDTHRLTDEVAAHYQLGLEAGRLTGDPIGQIEFLRTQSILGRFLPPPPAVVMDVGGASGVHALPLARKKYSVHLLDPVPLHIDQAREASAKQDRFPLASAQIGDARALPFDDLSADAILLLGPLYHLTERIDRMAAWREARRVLRPGGLVFGASISRYASLIDGFSHHPPLIDDPMFVDLMVRDLREGQHRNPKDNVTYFTTAFFHHPDELREELREAGFSLQTHLGLEGLTWSMPDLDSRWSDRDRRVALLSLLERLETDPFFIAASFHTIAIGSRP